MAFRWGTKEGEKGRPMGTPGVCTPSLLSTVAIAWSLVVYASLVGNTYATMAREVSAFQGRFTTVCLLLIQGVALAYYVMQWKRCRLWTGYLVYLTAVVTCRLLVPSIPPQAP